MYQIGAMQKCLSSGQPGLCEGQNGRGDKGEKEERLRWTKIKSLKIQQNMKRKHQHLPTNSSNIRMGSGGRGGSRLDSLERQELYFLTLLFKSFLGPSCSSFHSPQDLVTYRLNFEYENYCLHLVLFSPCQPQNQLFSVKQLQQACLSLTVTSTVPASPEDSEEF